MKINNTFLFIVIIFFLSCKDSEVKTELDLVIIDSLKIKKPLQNLKTNTFKSPKLNLFIFSINDWEKSWENDGLSTQYKNSAIELKNYFEKEFNANTYLFLTKDSTRRAFLVDWLESDFENLAKDNLNLFFIMSHGYSDIINKKLYLIPSDAKSNPPKPSECIFGSQIIEKLVALENKRATIFTFIDACYSDAIMDNNSDITAEIENLLSDYCNLTVSALSDKKAFEGSFTKAFLKVLRSSESCTSITQPEEKLREQILTMLHLEDNEGHINVPVKYSGNFCLESFSELGSFLFLHNFTDQKIYLTLEDLNGKILNYSTPLLPGKKMHYKLKRSGEYSLKVYYENGYFEKHPISFKNSNYINGSFNSIPSLFALGEMFEYNSQTVSNVGNDPYFVNSSLDFAELSYFNDITATAQRSICLECLIDSSDFYYKLAVQDVKKFNSHPSKVFSIEDIDQRKESIENFLAISGIKNELLKTSQTTYIDTNIKNYNTNGLQELLTKNSISSFTKVAASHK